MNSAYCPLFSTVSHPFSIAYYSVPNLFTACPMPLGIVCQLRYHGGGLLQCGAEESLLPFWSSATPLHVGQTVHFSLVKRGGHDEAAELQVRKPAAETMETIEPSNSTSGTCNPCNPCTPNLWKPGNFSDPVAVSLSEPSRQLRRLQRQRQRFQNASEAERRRWLQRAEQLLAELLTAEDGDGIIRWVYRLVAWLQPPGCLGKDAGTEDIEDIEDTGDEVRDGENGFQSWVRRLLILALNALDVEDLKTYRKLEVALNYIAQLLQGKEMCEVPEVSEFLPKNASLALQQWQQLRSLIAVEAPTDDWSDRPSDPGTRKARRENMKGKDKSSSMDGIYRPNARVRSLPSVSIGDQVELQCVHCSERLHSSWYWFHPKKEKAYVLAPQFGHAVCTKKVGKLCNWRSMDQTPTVLDNYHHLDFCQHKKRRSACIECEGTDICQHKRQRSHCRLCKAKNKAAKMDRADAAVRSLGEIKTQQHTVWGFHTWGYLQLDGLAGKISLKWMIWVLPLFVETPIWIVGEELPVFYSFPSWSGHQHCPDSFK